MTTNSPHVASVAATQPAFESELGSVTVIDAASLPILQGLSIKRVVLEPGTIREPQWNVNANQLAYCTAGTVLVSILGNADAFSSFVVTAGQMYHVESGAVYHIENIGEEKVAQIEMSLDEALANVMRHAYKGSYEHQIEFNCDIASQIIVWRNWYR